MFGSQGLLKLLHYQNEGDLHLKRPFHYSTHFDHTGANGTVLCEYSASRRPPLSTGYWLSFAGMIFTGAMCAFSRRAHEEKWWIANLILTIGYMGSWKFHKAENGVIGHTAGIWCAFGGFLFTLMRMFAGAGNARWNRRMMVFYVGHGWIDWGRLHQWIEHTNEIKKNVVPLKMTIMTSMFAEYIPAHEEPELIMLRKLTSIDDLEKERQLEREEKKGKNFKNTANLLKLQS